MIENDSFKDDVVEYNDDDDNKYGYYCLFLQEYVNCNPNGDKDNNNVPRYEEVNGEQIGQISPFANKYRAKSYIKDNKEGVSLYNYKDNPLETLSNKHNDSYNDLISSGEEYTQVNLQKKMLNKYLDLKYFGAVLNVTNHPAVCVTGSVKVGWGVSVSPIETRTTSIIRNLKTKPECESGKFEANKNIENGEYSYIPYGLYKTFIYINENAAQRNNLKQSDISELFDAFCLMDCMESNGTMRNGTCRGLFVLRYKKGAKFPGNTYVDKLINIKIKDGIEIPSNINDFEISINETNLDIIKNGRNKGKFEFYNHMTGCGFDELIKYKRKINEEGETISVIKY